MCEEKKAGRGGRKFLSTSMDLFVLSHTLFCIRLTGGEIHVILPKKLLVRFSYLSTILEYHNGSV